MEGDQERTGGNPAPEADRDDVAAATDNTDTTDVTARGTALPPRVESWRRRSAAGAILTGFALGLQEAFDPQRNEPSIVVQTSGDPPKDLPVEADFEYGRPRHSVVSIRPWLLGDQAPAAGEDGAAPSVGDGSVPSGGDGE